MSSGLSRPQIALYAAALVVVTLLAARYLGGGPGPSSSAPPSGRTAAPVRVESARSAGAIVHVAGEVRRPGVYRMPAGARIDDAVREAGGATARADLGGVNLAAKVEDGRQVLVPRRVPVAAGAAGQAGGGDVSAGGAAGGGAAGGGAAPGQPLNLNTATLEQLDTLAGVGPVTAQKILDVREQQGGFGSVDELAQVPGIGDKRLASLREQVRV